MIIMSYPLLPLKDLDLLEYFLGLEVTHSKHKIYLSKRKYALDILEDTCYFASQVTISPREQNLHLRLH